MKRIIFILFLSIIGAHVAFAGVAIKVQDGILCYMISNGVHVTGMVDKSKFNNDQEKKIQIPSSIIYADQTYSVTQIDAYAFAGCDMRSVTIPNTVTTIEENAFRDCKWLTSINLFNVKNINEKAFRGCSRIKEIYFVGTTKEWCTKSWEPTIISRNYDLFINNQKVTDLVIPEDVSKTSSYIFAHCNSLTSLTIPGSITTTSWGSYKDCKNLHTVIVSEGVKRIGVATFSGCTNLQNVHLPKNLRGIGSDSFYECLSLRYLIVPDSVAYIEGDAFKKDQNLSIYTSSSADFSKSGIPAERLFRTSPQEAEFCCPFSVYAKRHIEPVINEWQKKGEFERTSDWQKRVNNETRQQKIQSLLSEAEQKYLDYWMSQRKLDLQLGRYDADNEVFAVSDANYGVAYIAVPYTDAQAFKDNWAKKKITSRMQITDDQFQIAYLSIKMPRHKEYTYRNTDVVNYNLAEIKYNFDPIDFDFHKNTTPQQNQQNNQKSTIRAGKSLVDTDIPETNASNPNTFVLIFANEDYRNVASVPFAKNDGTIFQKYCQKTLGIPAKNIHYVENATYNDMRIQLSWAKDVCEAFDGQASFIIYYTGHGIPDEASGASYLLPVDGDGRYVASAYNLDEFYQKLGAMNAKSVTVLLDACFSGASRDGNMVVQAKGVVVKPKPGTPQGKTVVFAAAQEKETAGFNEAEGHGMFTYFLLKKLQETKGDVTLKDLGDYIITNVKQQSVVQAGKKQTPTVLSSPAVSTVWKNWKLK